MARPEERVAVRGGDSDLAAYLAELKRRGSVLLVTGDVSAAARAYVSRQFMGETDVSPPRRRILVDAGAERPGGEQYLPHPVTTSDRYVRVVRAGSGARSAAVASETGTGAGGGLARLRDDVVDAISELRGRDGPDSAGALRLGVTSLLPLVHRDGRDAVAELCDTFGSEVRAGRGIAHYHLLVPGDDRSVDALTATVDARIELRERNRLVEHRWNVPDGPFDGWTDWMAL